MKFDIVLCSESLMTTIKKLMEKTEVQVSF